MYVSRGCPPLLLSEVTQYKSKMDSDWDKLFKRVNKREDDGHAPKLVRALAHGEQACRKFEGKEGFRIKGDMWLKLGNMAVDSMESEGPTWVSCAGFEEAWKDIPKRGESPRL